MTTTQKNVFLWWPREMQIDPFLRAVTLGGRALGLDLHELKYKVCV